MNSQNNKDDDPNVRKVALAFIIFLAVLVAYVIGSLTVLAINKLWEL